jgi:sugar phosphate permease
MGSGIMLMLLLGTMFARRLHVAAKNETRALLISQTGIGVCLIAIVLMPNLLLGSVVFLAHEVLRGVFKPLKDAYLHDQIPSEQRATIISFESIAHHVGGGIGLIFTGAVAQLVSPTAAWIFAGLVLIVGSLLVGKNGKS